MHRTLLIIVAVSIGATLSATAGSMTRITDEADFRTMVVGQQMAWDGGSQVVNPDGTVNGTIANMGDFAGSWAWQSGYYCRNLVINGTETGIDCMTIEINGDDVRMVRDQGKGRVYDIKLK